ncbi:TPA: hypothetical protein DIV55_06200 [Patescibacteria group bacterium]|uniref:KaiB domain-containing protein n=1 Tax=Candidatus Curtissbacteria bacterium GW2011_GWA1_41_11 TaxID=1618409 RepID=A0A0G0WP12_9BACT|nr:MAG: hypothetical protein UU34_C0019G0003 [Candidatus Curtissbacteria bacterium GW2011_GWA1_41_11]HCS79298.1 hypothetical protein [Patescibacteria group bacterium]
METPAILTQVILFISKNSIYTEITLREFKTVILELEKSQPFKAEIIDINERPDLAEKYKIEATPTLIIGNKRFIGEPKAEDILRIVQSDTLSLPT